MTDLKEKHCLPCEGKVTPLSLPEIEKLLSLLNNWSLDNEKTAITKQYTFKNYYQTMAFVNAVAWVAHQENHHPDIKIGYNVCTISYHTHAIMGLSENDFICAAKVDALLDKYK